MTAPYSRHHRLIATSLLIVVAVVLIVLTARRTAGFSNSIELPLYDAMTRLTWPWKTGHPDVVLVTIRDNKHWPLNDTRLAAALGKIEQGGPAVIGVDLIRDDYRDSSPDGSDELRRIFGIHDNILMVCGLDGSDDQDFSPPPFVLELLAPEAQRLRVGLANFPLDGNDNRKVRCAYVAANSAAQFSLAALAASYYASGKASAGDEDLVGKLMRIGSLLPDAGGYNLPGSGGDGAIGNLFLLKFGPDLDERFPDYPLKEVLSMSASDLQKHFSGKVVLFGTHDPGTAKDEIPIIGNPGLRGIKLHAVATSQIIRELLDNEPPIRTSPQWLEDVLVPIFALLAATLILMRSSRSSWLATIFILTPPVLAFGLGLIALRSGVWIAIGAPMVAGTVSGLGALVLMVRFEHLEIESARRLFDRKFGPQQAAVMWEHRETVLAGGTIPSESFEGTILFSDLEGSTGASRQLEDSGDPNAFSEWAGSYTNRMTELVVAHETFVEAFMGDGLMIPFGYPPTGDDTHASNAIRCALAMRREVEEMNAELPPGHPAYRVRIGIYTGPIKGSQRGTGKQFTYALTGSAANLAKRLEEFRKESFRDAPETVRILVSQRTRDLLGEQVEAHPVDPDPVVIDKNTRPEKVWVIANQDT